MYAYVEFPTMMRACVVVGISDTCFVSLYHEFCNNGFSIDSFLSSIPPSIDPLQSSPSKCRVSFLRYCEEAKEERRQEEVSSF